MTKTEQKTIQVYVDSVKFPNLNDLNEHLSSGWRVVTSNNTPTYIIYIIERDVEVVTEFDVLFNLETSDTPENRAKLLLFNGVEEYEILTDGFPPIKVHKVGFKDFVEFELFIKFLYEEMGMEAVIIDDPLQIYIQPI